MKNELMSVEQPGHFGSGAGGIGLGAGVGTGAGRGGGPAAETRKRGDDKGS